MRDEDARSWPANRVYKWPLGKLIPYANNPRTHTDEQIAQIASSMREWGWTNPVLISEDGSIIAGHGRVAAARILGITHAPVMIAKGWTEAQRRAYVIADNQLALNAGWNNELLALEIGDLQRLGADVGLLGFSEGELARLLSSGAQGLTDPDEVPEPPTKPVSKPGDRWTLGRHAILCGDATDAATVLQLLDDVKPSLMVTDPPYGVDYDPKWRAKAGVNKNQKKMGKVENDDRADWREAWALFPGDVAYVWHSALHAGEVAESLAACGFEIRSQIIWAKDRFALSRGHYHWQHEPCWYAVRTGSGGAGWIGDRKQSTVWTIPARDGKGLGHGTQKPVEAMRRPIENNSSPGQAVYDPFLGSGTTVIAAETSGRVCLGLEVNPVYVDVICERWAAFTGQDVIHSESGKLFKRRNVAKK